MSVELEFDYNEAVSKIEKFNQNDINLLRDWSKTLDRSKSVPKDLTEKQLLLFFNACYFNIEKTKTCIEKYYACRKNSPEFFDNRSLGSNITKDVKNSLEALEFSLIPGKSVQGYDIVFHRLHNTEPSKYQLESGCKLLFMTVDMCLSQRGPHEGYLLLFDMRGVRLGHLTRISLSSLRKFFTYIQEGLPVRMKEIHVLNTEPIVDKLLLLIRPFMDKKLFDLIKFHNKNDDLTEFYEKVIPRSALPPDFGGTLPDTQTLHQKCVQQLKGLDPYFRAEEAQRHAALDKGKPIEENFKKLDID